MKKTSYLTLSVIAVITAIATAAPTASELLRNKTTSVIKSAQLTDANAFTKALLASEEWQHELWDSGPADQPEKVIQTLHDIWKSDPTLASRPVDRKMATACALEAPRRKWTTEQVLPRYNYFRDKWKYGLLNTMYENLSVFERRYLARGVQHGGLNSLASMEYHNQEVCLPAERYTGACWYARWILHNPFGDSIHGRHYYAPFTKSWESYSEVIRKVGGVCGSLSNFGAAAAIANGIPAVTMGEPGHCAYAVMIKPKHWQPAYSLSWKRGTPYLVPWQFMGMAYAQYPCPTRHRCLPQKWRSPPACTTLPKPKEPPKGTRSHYQGTHHLPTRLGKLVTLRKHPQGSPSSHCCLAKIPPGYYQTSRTHQRGSRLSPTPLTCLSKGSPKDGKNLDSIKARRKILLTYQHAAKDWGLARWDYRHALNPPTQTAWKRHRRPRQVYGRCLCHPCCQKPLYP